MSKFNNYFLCFALLVVFAGIPCEAQQLTAEGLIPQVLNPLRHSIVTSYPISELRAKFVDAVNDSSVIPSIAEKNSVVGGKSIGEKTPLAFSGPRPDGLGPAVIIVFENFASRMQYASMMKTPVEFREYLEDLLLSVYLHEYHHIKKQDFWRFDKSNTEVVAIEADCWTYTVKEILLPMRQGGRGKFLPGTFEDTVLKLYNEIGGNTADPRWMEFFRNAYGTGTAGS